MKLETIIKKTIAVLLLYFSYLEGINEIKRQRYICSAK